ncbi:MAG: hypothetical protein HZR80_02720 [Candidatus Heimdallarchaeota archaeon]
MTLLNWQTDSIYYDAEPKPVNQWINANELIEKGRREEILFDKTNILNLFPILVRRVDFVRRKSTDRILARFPYIQLADEEKEIINNKQLLISEKLRDYFYQSDNRSILEWRDALKKYLDRGFVPLPFLRCFSDYLTIDLLINRKFQSARGESFHMPTSLNKELAYLCGIVNGDGSLKKYILSIVDYSTENIKQLQKQFWEFFAQKGRIQYQSENWPELIITNLWVIRFFSFLTSQPIGMKKYGSLREPLILLDEPLRSYYWSGVMDADGSYKNGSVTLVSASEKFVSDFHSFLKEHNIITKITSRDDKTYVIYIPSKFHSILKKIIFCFHPEKKKEFNMLEKANPRIGRYFAGFNQSKLTESYFDFTLLRKVAVLGLSSYILTLRDDLRRNAFAKKTGIHPGTLKGIEEGIHGITLADLKKVLTFKGYSLMPFLEQKSDKLRYYKKNSYPVKMDVKPNPHLSLLSRQMIFYKNLIRIINTQPEFVTKIEEHFDIKISNNTIRNKTISEFYSNFALFSLTETIL